MNQELTIVLIGVLSAFLGTIVGGFISYYSSKSIKLLELKHNIQEKQIKEKKNLYSEFLKEISTLLLRSNKHKVESVMELDNMTNMIFQIELISDSEVVKTAKQIGLYLSEAHSQVPEFTSDIPFAELRKKFIEETKKELLNGNF